MPEKTRLELGAGKKAGPWARPGQADGKLSGFGVQLASSTLGAMTDYQAVGQEKADRSAGE